MKKKDKKERRNKIFLGFVLSIFLISSLGSVVIYYGDDSDQDSFTLIFSDKEYKFNRLSDDSGNLYYNVLYDNEDFLVYYLPYQISLDVENETQDLIRNSNYFYLSFDPHQEDLSLVDYMRFDLKNNMPSTKFYVDAVTQESELYNFPIISCDNSTINTPVIVLENTNTTNISLSNNCLNIEFTNYDFLTVRDMLVYLSNNINIG